MTYDIANDDKPFIKPEELIPVLGLGKYVNRLGPEVKSVKEAVCDTYVAAYHGSMVCLTGSGIVALVNNIIHYMQ